MKVSCMCHSFIYFICFYGCLSMDYVPHSSDETLAKASYKQKSVSSCQACIYLVQSFLKAVEETTRQSFAGGDADWEREKLGNYENSELRFIEIQEKLCSDLKSGIDQCYNLAELYETELETWFFERRNKDLLKYLCIDHLKICCPNNTFGPKCLPCPGGIERPCGGHGECKNGGTREQPALCICDAGYTGELCDNCQNGYYRDISLSELSCKVCDKACKDYCRGPGPNNCEVCSDGYSYAPNKGCIENKVEDPSEMISNETENLETLFKPGIMENSDQHSEHTEL